MQFSDEILLSCLWHFGYLKHTSYVTSFAQVSTEWRKWTLNNTAKYIKHFQGPTLYPFVTSPLDIRAQRVHSYYREYGYMLPQNQRIFDTICYQTIPQIQNVLNTQNNLLWRSNIQHSPKTCKRCKCRTTQMHHINRLYCADCVIFHMCGVCFKSPFNKWATKNRDNTSRFTNRCFMCIKQNIYFSPPQW